MSIRSEFVLLYTVMMLTRACNNRFVISKAESEFMTGQGNTDLAGECKLLL